MALFQTYLQEKKLCKDMISLQLEELAQYLKKFQCRSEEKDWSQYSKSTHTTVRFGLCRFIKSKRSELDIIKNDEFDEANVIFRAKTVEPKSMGLPKVEHKPFISKEDLRKVYNCGSFYTEDPQNKVWFEIMLFFCR